MNLPSPFQTYFGADERSDGKALINAFAPNAVLRDDDEGHSHAGLPAIEGWWREAKTKYQHVLELLKVTKEDDVTKVHTKLISQFPGSPVTRIFTFRLNGNQITNLNITE